MDNGFKGFYHWDGKRWLAWINCMGVQVDRKEFRNRKQLDAMFQTVNACVSWEKI